MKTWVVVAIATVSVALGFGAGWLARKNEPARAPNESVPLSDSQQRARIEAARERVRQDFELSKAEADETKKHLDPIIEDYQKTMDKMNSNSSR